ncbi:MAG: hypothetical protein CMJ59_21925 [Planctomycetaceae bacterium]|nr:hypothetical protein [Planctomycetaceae bacterium]
MRSRARCEGEPGIAFGDRLSYRAARQIPTRRILLDGLTSRRSTSLLLPNAVIIGEPLGR